MPETYIFKKLVRKRGEKEKQLLKRQVTDIQIVKEKKQKPVRS